MSRSTTTLKQIAETAGVSITTVHRVLNGKEGCGEQLRTRIMEIAKQQGYEINYVASSLRKKPIHIAVIFPKSDADSHLYVQEILNGYFQEREEVEPYNIIFQEYYYPAHDLESMVFLSCLNNIYQERPFRYDGVIVYKENISNIISAIRKITQIPIIILTDATSLLCMSWKKELIYAGADCVMDINSTIEEVDLQIFSLARRNNKQKITQKQSETMINKGKLVMDHKKHKVFWNDVALHLTRQEYNFLYLLAATPMRVYTFEQIYQLVWKDYPVGDIKNIIWCLVKRLRKKLNVVEDGAGNCIVSVRDIGYKFELNNENEQQ